MNSARPEALPCIVQMEGIVKRFGSLEVLKHVDLRVTEGTVTCIVGPSGAGKTTLLQIMGTIMRADEGRILIAGVEVQALPDRELSHFRNAEIGFVFQFHHLLPELTAVENVCVPALIRGERRSHAKARAVELLEYLGLSHRLSHRPQELSGGEQQRVAVARSLMNKPRIILADEPSGNLDQENKRELHALFFRLREELGQTFVIVTHDEQLASQSDCLVHMADGIIHG